MSTRRQRKAGKYGNSIKDLTSKRKNIEGKMDKAWEKGLVTKKDTKGQSFTTSKGKKQVAQLDRSWVKNERKLSSAKRNKTKSLAGVRSKGKRGGGLRGNQRRDSKGRFA